MSTGVRADLWPAAWYPDPWQVGTLRWWDGKQWTPLLFGPYGFAYPLTPASEFVPRGPGLKGGGIAAAGIAAGFGLSFVVLLVWFLVAGRLQLGSPWLLLSSQAALWMGFVGAPLLASRRHGTRSLRRDFNLAWPSPNDMALGLAGGLIGRLVSLLVVLPYVLLGHSRTGREPPSVLGSPPRGVAAWAVVVGLAVVGAPLVEELLFRGLIQGAFSRRIGAIQAIFVTGLIFAGIHTVNEGPIAPLLIFPSALILGWLRYRTGRLGAGMVAHATFNASLFVLLAIPALN